MALAPTNLQTTTFSNQVVQAYTEGSYFRDDLAVVVRNPSGGKTKRFPVFGNITVATQADGSDLSAGASYTPTSVDVSTFDPTIAYETLLYQTIADFEGYIPSSLSKRLGMDLALRRSNILLNIVAKVAYNRAASAGIIEAAGATSTAVLTDAVYSDMFNLGLATIRNAQINPANTVAVLRPEFFYALRRNTYMANNDYAKSGMTDNASMSGRFSHAGVEIVNAAGTFMGTDTSGTTTIPTSARIDLTKCWGVLFAKDSLAIYETESPHGQIEDIPHRQSWLSTARTIFGAASLQPAGQFVFGNFS
jgi:hypothetical protein